MIEKIRVFITAEGIYAVYDDAIFFAKDGENLVWIGDVDAGWPYDVPAHIAAHLGDEISIRKLKVIVAGNARDGGRIS